MLFRARLRGEYRREPTALRETVAGRTGNADLDILALAERGTAHLRLQQLDDAERDLTDAEAPARAHGRDHVVLHCLTLLAARSPSGRYGRSRGPAQRSEQGQRTTFAARLLAERWAAVEGWDVVTVTVRQGRLLIAAAGSTPVPDGGALRANLAAAGLDDVSVRLRSSS